MEFGSPLDLDLQFVCFAALVVEDMKFNNVDAFVEAGHDAIDGGETVAVVAGLDVFN